VLQVLQLALEVRDARRVGLLFCQLANLEAVLLGQTVQAPCPALAAAYDGGLDKEAFPFPRRAEGTSKDCANELGVRQLRGVRWVRWVRKVRKVRLVRGFVVVIGLAF
jgi:hypothetical protein